MVGPQHRLSEHPRPYQEDEAGLIEALADSVLDMIAAVNRFPDVDDPQAEAIASDYTWSRVFEPTFSVYKEMVPP